MNINHTDDQLMHHNLTNTHCLLDTLLWHWASVLRCASHHIMILSTKIQWWQQPRGKEGYLKYWFISALNMSIIDFDWLRCVKWCDYERQRSSFHTEESESDQSRCCCCCQCCGAVVTLHITNNCQLFTISVSTLISKHINVHSSNYCVNLIILYSLNRIKTT